MIDLATLTFEVPYDGVAPTSGFGFALDQFAQAQGAHNFAEWAAMQFMQGRSISGSVVKSDDLDTAAHSSGRRTTPAFGYDVMIWITPSDDGR